MPTKQDVLAFMREQAYKPMTYQELEQAFEIKGGSSFKAFLEQLNELESEGEIVRTRTDRYGVPSRMNLIRGRMQAHVKGFGFVIPEEAGHPDVFVNPRDFATAMHGDTVLVRPSASTRENGKLEGEVIRVIKRGNDELVGTYQDNGTYGFVIADERRIGRDIFVPKESSKGAMTGHKVVVKIIEYPEGRSAAQAEVVEILGHKNDPGVDILSVIRKYDLSESFPDEVMAEAESAPEQISEADMAGRRDLRDVRMVTIDGEDAKDLDDAVHIRRLENGNIQLGVHIADVGHYVPENSQLDLEAYRRGTSVYLVDRVIPMLPHRLSNGICSLNPQVDRLALSCEMEFDAQAKVVKHEIFTSVIRTNERMTYTNVRRILQDEDAVELIDQYGELVDDFKLMEQLALLLRDRRMKRGAIDFDLKEAKVIVDEEGKPTEIQKRERSIAEKLIEEFMLAANETVAEHFHSRKVPFLYRIHEDPDPEKLQHFAEFVTNFGFVLRGLTEDVHPLALQKILQDVEGSKEEAVISTVLLRSMKQAKYGAESIGHFGLAAEFYSHFTSPIRRYPDLVIHRIIREVAEHGKLSSARHDALTARLPEVAKHSSERERVAVDAERETDSMKKAEYMMDKVGEVFDGIVSGVTSFGMFVELDNTVEGLIRLSDLNDDYYHHHPKIHALIGERTARTFRIGDEVKVQVVRVDVDERTIDFELIGAKTSSRQGQHKAIDLGDAGGGRGRKKNRRRSNATSTPTGPAVLRVKANGSAAQDGAGKKKKRHRKGARSANPNESGDKKSIAGTKDTTSKSATEGKRKRRRPKNKGKGNPPSI